MNKLPTLAVLNACTVADFVETMDGVWEHAPWIAEAVARLRTFASVDALHRAMLDHVAGLPEDRLLALLAGHPDLAGADARGGQMTADSTAEQAGLSLARLSTGEARRWDELNAAYRGRFGFPFILCIRRHSLASALKTFERRLANDRPTEIRLALEEIGRITRLRLAARIADHGLADIAGRLTTHVLDISHGRAAAGMRIELYEVSAAGARRLVDAVTDSHGQTPAALLAGEPLRIGRYELRFHVGDYFRGSPMLADVAEHEELFLDVVPVVFGVREPEGDYHVPLTVTPWAYGTYRGQ